MQFLTQFRVAVVLPLYFLFAYGYIFYTRRFRKSKAARKCVARIVHPSNLHLPARRLTTPPPPLPPQYFCKG